MRNETWRKRLMNGNVSSLMTALWIIAPKLLHHIAGMISGFI